MSDLVQDVIHQWQCPTCEMWFDEGDGLVPHILFEHPFSAVARDIDDMLLSGLLDGKVMS